MKKLFSLFFAFILITTAAWAEEYDILTADGLEQALGINTSSADVESIKVIMQSMDEAFVPYYEIRERCLTRLYTLGETELMEEYLKSTRIPIKFTELSYTELLDMKDDLNLAMWLSKDWQEVTVPQGTWKVGEDIPAGHWTVKSHPGTWATHISWGEHLNENKESISYRGRYSISNTVYNPNNETFDPINDVSEYSFEVQEGDYIVITYGAAVFMPYVGKPSFNFK